MAAVDPPGDPGASERPAPVRLPRAAIRWLGAAVVAASGIAAAASSLTSTRDAPPRLPIAAPGPARAEPDDATAATDERARLADDADRAEAAQATFEVSAPPSPAEAAVVVGVADDGAGCAPVSGPDGALVLDTRPRAEVAIDGRSFGRTPLHGLSLAPGRHRVSLLSRELGIHAHHELTIVAGEETRLMLTLEELPHTILVTPVPDRATR